MTQTYPDDIQWPDMPGASASTAVPNDVVWPTEPPPTSEFGPRAALKRPITEPSLIDYAIQGADMPAFGLLSTGKNIAEGAYDFAQRAYEEYQAAPTAEKAKPPTAETPNQVWQGLQAGIPQAKQMYGRFAEGMGHILGWEGAAKSGKYWVDESKAAQEELPARVPSARNIRGDTWGHFFQDAASFMGYQAGQGVISTMPSLALSGLATVATRSPRIGTAVGTAVGSYPQNYGDVYGGLKEDKDIYARVQNGELSEKQLAASAIAPAVVMTALDMWGMDNILGKELSKTAKQDLAKRIVKGFASGALVEGTTEGLQEVVKQWFEQWMGGQKGAYEQFWSIVDNFLGGAATGAPTKAVMTAVPGRQDTKTSVPAPAPMQEADQLRSILGEPPPPPGAAPVEDQRSILGEDRPDESRPDQEYYVAEAMRNLLATSRTAKGVLDLSSTTGKEDQMTDVSAKHAATLAQENFEGVIRGIYDRLDDIPQDGPSMAAFIDGTAEAVNEGIVKPGKIIRENDTKIPALTAARDLPAAHAQFSEEMATRLADPNADPVETAAWIEWRSNMIDHFWSDGVGKASKALAAIPLMRAGLPLPNYPSSREFFSYSPKERVDPSGGGEAYLGPAWDRFNAFYHTLVDKPEPQQRADLKAMFENAATPLDDIISHPLVQRAREANRSAVSSGTREHFADPAWRQQRVYDFGGEPVQGWDNAVERLTDAARAFSTAEPVEQGHHAVIVLGPPAAGKSTVSEPLARSLRAALVDADEVKKVIPEYRNGLGSSAAHEESSELAKDVLQNLIRDGSNIVLPKVGQSYEIIKGMVDGLKKLGYRVDIAHIAATPEISQRRNIARFLETGRLVDPEYIEAVGDKPRNTAYMLKGETNDFVDADTSKGFEIVEGSGPLADALRTRRNVGWSPSAGYPAGSEGTAGRGPSPELIGEPVFGMQAHRVTDADGRTVEVAPVVVEAGSLRTSRDYGYDQDLQPRDRDRAASDAQIREIESKLDPERLGYSSEADRGSPIIGSDRMVESGNGRVIALRNVYDKNSPQAQSYRDWLRRQGVNVDAYQNPVLVRQRLTPLTPKERQAFTLAANRSATLAMSAPERAVSDARHMDARMLGLIKNPDDIGSVANRAFFRRFLSMLPKSEHGTLADAKGHLSAEGLMRARNAILAKAYGDTAVLARIAESTNDDVKSISNALTAAAPAWAAMRADVESGHVRADVDITTDLVRAVERTAEIRSRGESLDAFLAQQDAFDLPAEIEGFMRMFYDPKGRRAAAAKRITDALRFYADEASKVSAEKGLGLDLVPVAPQDIQRLALQREWQDVEQQGVSESGRGVGDVSRDAASGREARGPWLGEGREVAAQRGDAVDSVEEAIRAQRPTIDELRAGTEPIRANAETWWTKDLTPYGRNQMTNAASVPERIAKTAWRHIPPDTQKKLAAVIGTARDPARTEPVKLAGRRSGDQFVFPGGERISTAELARRRAAEPLRPRVTQKAADVGLFGEMAPQGDLLVAPVLKQAVKAPTVVAGNEETGDGRPGIQPAAPTVPGRTQARRLAKTPASRPPELPLFGWEPSERPVRHPDEPVRPEPGGQESPVHGEGTSVTKPPARGGRNRPGRADLPAVKGRLEAEKKIAERSRSNYRITPEDQVGVGNARQKIKGNIEAIRTLKAVQDENRFATPAEKAILVKYVGWGAFAQDMFATHKPEWKNERDAFRALVSDDEYNAAKASTLNAHFTSPDVIRGMWDAMGHLGFKGGQAIEPAAGTGHFVGLIPDKFASKTAWTAVELDPLTGGIAKALYGGTDVGIHGFEDLKRPSNYYDLAISNVPFGDYHISEKPYGSFPIHDFFFVKSLDKVRPGGVVAFITSRFTMDRVDPETRRLLGQTADLVGAIRLPGGRKGAFAGNAGTEVTTDIIFLRKKAPGEPAFPGASWTDVKEIQTPDGSVNINEYFADRPDMMLGEMRLQGSMYRANEPVLVGDAEGIQQRIAEAARKMPEGALLPMDSPAPPPISGDEIGAGIKDGSFFQNGKLYQRRQGQGFEHPLNPEDHDRVARLVDMRGIINDLLQTQLDAGENARAQADGFRAGLRNAYDAFVAKYGPINKEVRTVTDRLDKEGEPVVIVRTPNFTVFKKDPDAWKVAAIEDYDSETGKTKRAAIQTKDVIDAPMERQINAPSDALSASLNDTAGVDLDHIAQSLNLDSHDAVVQALGDLVYQNPDGRKWETADQYLSGNVVKKLEDARALSQQDPSYLRNVASLEKVQPEPLTGTDITAQFGAPWIPENVYQDFLSEIGIRNPRMVRVPITGEWRFDYGGATQDAQIKYGTNRVEVGKIINAAINNKTVTVYDRSVDDKAVVNDSATQEARVKTELLKEAFTGDMEHGLDGWVFAEPDRAQLLEGIYNRTYNNLAQRQFDGSHLTLPGLNPDFATRKHRRDAIWRIIQSGNTLLAHVVGAGKTSTMVAAAMEEKRLGLINKPAMVVPNHMLEQFSREFIQAYPNAKILVAQKDEMTRENRKEFLAKVAANDWDSVIITHDAFGRINMGQEFRKNFIQDQLDELERVMRAEVAAGDKKSQTVKNLEKAKKKLQERLQNLMNEERKDEGTSFEESGIDRLYVDEAHKFKNLQFISKISNIAGLAQGNSQRAEDLFLKIRYLEQKRPGRSAVFATGTPVSNTMAELWTMMRYLELDKLRERGLDTFDAWASTFGRVVNNMELSADGRTFKERASFSKFVNIPELVALYSEVADTKTADMLNLPRPEVRTRSGAPGIEIVEATPSAQEEAHIEELVKLAESLKGKRPEKGQPNMLSVVTAGRKVATDGRLISSDFDFNPRGKIALAVDNISRIYQEGNKDPAAPNKVQMVFLDMGVPQSRSAKKKPRVVEGEESVGPTQQDRIDLYADLKQRLAAQGIPAREIAAIHDAGDDIKKAKLFKRVRSGEIRVILGSSEKMGVGTNVQDLLIAMHHLDAPWKPAEVEQRDGRIVRQGNLNKEVQIYRYVTKKSFDAFMWQKLDTKARFIGQVLSGAKGSRHAEDIDNPLPEAAEMKAAASGDPRILEHAELDRIVRSLSAQRRAFDSTKSRANSGAAQAKSRIEMYEKALPNAKEDAAAVQDIAGDKFAVELGDAGIITSRAEAGKAILGRLAGIDARSFYAPKVFVIGRMSGFAMNMEVRGGWDGTQAILRATPSLKGKSGYGAANDTVINEHTDPAGLIRRYENILANIKFNPERLTRELANEKESLGKLQKTLTGEWPREKEYRAALKKLDDLTKSMKAPEHPDVAEAQNAEVKAQVATEEKEFLTVKDKPAWAVVVDPIDNAILHGVRYKHAFDNGFHHSSYLPERYARMVSDGDAILAWADDRGVHAMEPLSPQMQAAVERHYEGPEKALRSDAQRIIAEIANSERLKAGVKEALVFAVNSLIAHGSQMHGSYLDGHISEAVSRTVHQFRDVAGVSALQMRNLVSKVAGMLAKDSAFVPRGWETAGARDFGPQPGEHAIRIGRDTYGYVSGKYSAAEQKIADAVKAIGARMAPQANVAGTRALRMRGDQIWGAFVNNEAFPHLIAWSLEKVDTPLIAGTVRHEIVHHLREAELIRPSEWAALHDAAINGDWLGKHNIEDRYPGLSRDAKIEEAVAEEFANWRTDHAVIKTFKDPVQRLIRDAFNRIDLMLRRVAAAARQFLGRNATASDIFTRIETGEVGRREMVSRGREQEAAAIDSSHDVKSGAVASKNPNGPVFIDRHIPELSPKLKDRDGNPANLWKYLRVHETQERKAMAEGMPYETAHETIATPAERAAVEADGVDWKAYTHEIDGYLATIEHERVKNPPPNPHVDPGAAVNGKPHHHSANKAETDVRAQTPGREARERRQTAGVPARTILQRVVQSSDALRARADAFADRIGVNEIVRGLQMNIAPMAARDATVESRLIAKEYANARRQSRHDWNSADKFILDNFPADRRKAMWEAADEQSVAMQQGLPTAGIGLDRLPPNERAVVDMLQARGLRNFDEARTLRMVQTEGLPSYAPRMLVRMTDNKAEVGAGAGSEIVKDIRTLALANARLEDAIAGRKLINAIEDVGRRSGNPTVNGGGTPPNRIGAEGVVVHALDQIGRDFATTTPQLRYRKHLTAAETEAAANLVRTPGPDAPKWFTLNNPAFMKMEPRLRVNETTGKAEVVKDSDGNPIFDRKPIYVRSDFEGPLRSVLESGFDTNKLYQALMSLKGKAMSVIMMSPLIHNQVEWGRALPAAPGKVLTFQIYLEGNRIAHDPDQMRQAIAGGTAPIGGHGFMQDLSSIAEAPTVRPGRSWVAKGAGYAAEAGGHITRLFDPRARADDVRRAVDYMGNFWHNTLLWDRVRDLQMGLWSHINEYLLGKGYNPYASNVAASHFANRYAGALPLEAMSGNARGIANLLLFSRTFTLGNLGAFKDAAIGLPRDAQAMIQHHAGWEELQKIQSFVKRKSQAMLAFDAGLYYVTLSTLQSAFNTAGVVPTVATLGGMIAGGALGGRGGKYGRIAAAVGGGAAAFGLAAVLGASPGTKKLEDELESYWERFAELLRRNWEHPFEAVIHPIDALESLSATAENEPGKKGRLLVGFEPDGTSIYARLAVGKVTEEFIGWWSSPNEMLHNKLSTFARPMNQIWSNDVGFGHKLYNPKAETYWEKGKNAIKIGAAIVGSQIPLDTIKGAKEWFEGGPGSDVAGLKAISPFIGTTVSKGYPGGPELGVINDARERQKFQLNEWMPTIRKQIKNGEIDTAIEKMQELGVAPGLQKFYIQTTQNPKARLTKRQMQDFMRYATPEQKREFEAAQGRGASETRSTGGAVAARANGGRANGGESYAEWRERIGWANGGRVLARANGGRVDASNIDHEPTEAQKHAGNYAKDRIHTLGMEIVIETAKGSKRSGVGKDGHRWDVVMPCHYGYIRKA